MAQPTPAEPFGPAPPPSAGRINLRILTPGDGMRESIEIRDVPSDISVATLKDRITLVSPAHPPALAQRLIFAGRVLADDNARLLDALGISARNTDMVTLHMIIRGGQPQSAPAPQPPPFIPRAAHVHTSTPTNANVQVGVPHPASDSTTNAPSPAPAQGMPAEAGAGPGQPALTPFFHGGPAGSLAEMHRAAHEAAISQALPGVLHGLPQAQASQQQTPRTSTPQQGNGQPRVVGMRAQITVGNGPFPPPFVGQPGGQAQLFPPSPAPNRGPSPGPGLPNLPGFLPGVPNSHALAQSLANLRAQEQLLNTPQSMYLLSSPLGPYALLHHNDSYYTARIPGPTPAPTSASSHHATHLRQATRATNDRGPPEPQPGAVPAAVPPQVAGNAPALAAANPQQAGEVDLLAPIQPLLNHFWLILRVLFFAYFFLGDEGWTRYMIIAGLVVAFLLLRGLNAGNAVLDTVRGWWEGVMGVRPAAQPAAALPGGQERAAGAAPSPLPAAANGQPQPQQQQPQTAAPTTAQDQDTHLPPWRRRLRPIERAVALFIASLWPGVGETTIRRRREEEQRQRAEREAALAAQAAGAAAVEAVDAEAGRAATAAAADGDGAPASSGAVQTGPATSQDGEQAQQGQSEEVRPDGSDLFEPVGKASGVQAEAAEGEGLRQRGHVSGKAEGSSSAGHG